MDNFESVYIILSEKTNKYYTGKTNDFERRLWQHNAGLNKSTKSGNPWKLVWKSEKLNQNLARILEIKIKKRGAGRFLADTVEK